MTFRLSTTTSCARLRRWRGDDGGTPSARFGACSRTDSVVKALDAFDKPVILLAGGHDKMTPLEDFMNIVKAHTKEVIFMGEAADRFESVAVKMGVQNIHRAQSMKEAVALGYQLAKAGDIVLLSPACSSFDWYSCFEERGDDFKNCVKELEERG